MPHDYKEPKEQAVPEGWLERGKMRENTFARMAYEAYRQETGIEPEWQFVHPDIQDAWRSAAIAVMAAVEGGL